MRFASPAGDGPALYNNSTDSKLWFYESDATDPYPIGARSLELRYGTNPTELTLYNTYTDASNYERGFLKWNANYLEIGCEAAGTGTARSVKFTSSVYLPTGSLPVVISAYGSSNRITSDGGLYFYASGNYRHEFQSGINTSANAMPFYTYSQWNNATTVHSAFRVNAIVDTASAADSRLAEFQHLSTDRVWIDKYGTINQNTADIADGDYLIRLKENGTDKFWVKTRDGMYLSLGSSRAITIARDGITSLTMGVNGTAAQIHLNDTGWITWNPNAALSGGGDLYLRREAAGTLAQYNSTNAQTFNIYNTYTDASNYERGFIRWNSNVLEIGTAAAGTGATRDVKILRGTATVIHSTVTGNNIYLGTPALGATAYGSIVAAGLNALGNASSGASSGIVAVGGESLRYLDVPNGSPNAVAIGYGSGTRVRAAGFTVLVGGYAGCGSGAVTARLTHTTAVGYNAGFSFDSTTLSDNSLFGYAAGYAISSGNQNTLIGSQAGDGITTGSNNIVIGYDQEPDSGTADDQINVGGRYYHDRLVLGERAADPSDPAEGNFALWMSDGTGSGDDGDLMVKITAGGVTATTRLTSLKGQFDSTEYEFTGTYVYYGGAYATGAWEIRRVTVADGTKVVANEANNGSYTDLATAWTNRASLTYA